MLDRFQKLQHPYELEPSNTKPITFFLLAVVQFPACFLVSHLLETSLEITGLTVIPCVTIGINLAGFLISEIIQSCFMFDLTGEMAFAVAMAYSFWRIDDIDVPSTRQMLCASAFYIWCIRLGWFLFHRILVRGSDWRFNKLITEPCYNGFCWVCQGTWVWLQGMCLWTLNASPPEFAAESLSWIDAVGLGMWAIGLCIEVAADHQKSKWNHGIPSNSQKTWIDVGLWRYSRHPNFFGEMLLWAGLSIAACAGLGTLSHLCLACVSSVWSAFFLICTSLVLLEKRLDARFGGQAAYEQYKLSTSVLIPWPISSPRTMKSE